MGEGFQSLSSIGFLFLHGVRVRFGLEIGALQWFSCRVGVANWGRVVLVSGSHEIVVSQHFGSPVESRVHLSYPSLGCFPKAG